MVFKKTFLTLVLILVSSMVFALGYSPSLDVCLWPDLCFPTESYLLEYPGDPSVEMPIERTSFGFEASLYPFGLSFGRFRIGLGVSYRFVSQSLAFGISRLKSYGGLGVSVSLGFGFSDWEVDFGLSCFDMRFSGSDDSFPACEGEACLRKALDIGRVFDVAVFGGLSVFAKGDSVSLCPKMGGSVSWERR